MTNASNEFDCELPEVKLEKETWDAKRAHGGLHLLRLQNYASLSFTARVLDQRWQLDPNLMICNQISQKPQNRIAIR